MAEVKMVVGGSSCYFLGKDAVPACPRLDFCKGGARFGCIPYAAQELLRVAEQKVAEESGDIHDKSRMVVAIIRVGAQNLREELDKQPSVEWQNFNRLRGAFLPVSGNQAVVYQAEALAINFHHQSLSV